ncbi:MAG: hypothetical protein JSW38_11095 [Dehalococcoidia bacterium]|nr:MAG: hypothetical protein JSW38_11095 [Dehalococcoidia bacterium]
MNIEINLLPVELRPRPPVETKNLIVALLIVALVACSVFLYIVKSSADSDREGMENRIDEVNREIAALQAQARSLTDDISAIKAANKSYDAFIAARIDWGDAIERVQELKPQGIDIESLTQDGRTLEVGGSARQGYGTVASYARSLDDDRRFSLAGIPSLKDGDFSLILAVAPGGGS